MDGEGVSATWRGCGPCAPARPPLTITAASEPVRRLLGLLAWDTDPGIEASGRSRRVFV